MTCQKCQEEASVHLTESIDGKIREVHLCKDCARKAGLLLTKVPNDLALDSVVQNLITAHVGELVGELAQRTCPVCGLKFMEFRADGQLGCPHDYKAFDPGLIPLIRRIHGASRHVGKVPRRCPAGGSDRKLLLRAELRDAVAKEDYERAARLRDMIRQKDPDA